MNTQQIIPPASPVTQDAVAAAQAVIAQANREAAEAHRQKVLREKQRLAAAKVKHAADRASYEARIADAAKASDGAALAAVLQECRKDNVTVAGNDPCVRFHIAAHDLLVRLCAAIPPPWFNMVRYFGVPLQSLQAPQPRRAP